MFKWLYPVVIAFLYSCASVSADWGPWEHRDVPKLERRWRFCSVELDGPEYDKGGVCWIAKECRTKKTIFNNAKEECRKKVLHCPEGAIDCRVQYGINNMTIMFVQ